VEFLKFFHQKAGVSFDEWLRRVRVKRAIDLMAFGDRSFTEQSPTEVARERGFRNPRTFERAVEQRTGDNPAA
jgi:transcriptional regulator GlxA family with amidase domain